MKDLVAATEKAVWEYRKLRLDFVVAAIAVGLAAIIASGSFLIIFYMLRLRFNPGGIGAADSFTFGLTFAGFLVALAAVLFLFTLAAFPVAWVVLLLVRRVIDGINLWRLKHRGETPPGQVKLIIGAPIRHEWRPGVVPYLVLGIVMSLVIGLNLPGSDVETQMAIFQMFCVGFWTSLFVLRKAVPSYCNWKQGARPAPLPDLEDWKRVAIPWCVAFAMMMFLFPRFQDGSMRLIGFRDEDVAVRLSNEDFALLLERATAAGHVVNECGHLDSMTPVVEHTDVLLEKIGTAALVHYPALKNAASARLREQVVEIQPKNATTQVVSGRQSAAPCSELPMDKLLTRDGHASSSAVAQVRENVKWMPLVKPNDQLEVVAYGAVNDWKTASVSLARSVSKAFSVPSGRVVALLVEDEPKWDCKGLDDAKACTRINRRIEIRMASAP